MVPASGSSSQQVRKGLRSSSSPVGMEPCAMGQRFSEEGVTYVCQEPLRLELNLVPKVDSAVEHGYLHRYLNGICS